MWLRRVGNTRPLCEISAIGVFNIDNKMVNKAIKQHIFPLLKENDFKIFTQRSAWRYRTDKIEVVNFQSFNSFLAGNLGCTTFSFAVRLGIYYKCIPWRFPAKIKERDGNLCPEENACHFRKPLLRELNQIGFTQNDVWFINSDGSYLSEALDDVKHGLTNYGLPWFERFEDMNEVLRTLLEDDEEIHGTHGFGRNPSPIRSYQTGYVALSIGNYQVAEKALKEAIKSGRFHIEQLIMDYESRIK